MTDKQRKLWYFGVKFLEWKSGVERHYYRKAQQVIEKRGLVYGFMLMSFYGGSVLFTVAAFSHADRCIFLGASGQV